MYKNKTLFIGGLLCLSTCVHLGKPVSFIQDVSKFKAYPVSCIEKPKTIDELRDIVKSSSSISIAGGRYSHGGQIAPPKNGTVVDITGLNKIDAFDRKTKTITVESGITWREIQEFIDKSDLSIQIMQSYNDFTVGGSLGVNPHGRYISCGPLIESVKKIKIMLADGMLIIASREKNSDIFYASIGGYGGLGVITQATLQLTDNRNIEENIEIMDIQDYPAYFKKIKENSDVVFHNANIFPNKLKKVQAISYVQTDKPLTVTERLQNNKLLYVTNIAQEEVARIFPAMQNIRARLSKPTNGGGKVVTRNWEMSYPLGMLGPLARPVTTCVLQEYFVPVDQLLPFIERMRQIINWYNVNMLNISIRYVPQNTESVLSYVKNESFAVVCYICLNNADARGQESVIKKTFSLVGFKNFSQVNPEKWTRELIDAALECGGTYYLPYQLYATKNQMYQAYPNVDIYKKIKRKYDPENKFVNTMLYKYDLL